MCMCVYMMCLCVCDAYYDTCDGMFQDYLVLIAQLEHQHHLVSLHCVSSTLLHCSSVYPCHGNVHSTADSDVLNICSNIHCIAEDAAFSLIQYLTVTVCSMIYTDVVIICHIHLLYCSPTESLSHLLVV